jgi:hypothetical protein
MIQETTLDNGELAVISTDDVYEILDTIIFGSKHDELRIHVKQQDYCISREQTRELLPYLQQFVETGHILEIKKNRVIVITQCKYCKATISTKHVADKVHITIPTDLDPGDLKCSNCNEAPVSIRVMCETSLENQTPAITLFDTEVSYE